MPFVPMTLRLHTPCPALKPTSHPQQHTPTCKEHDVPRVQSVPNAANQLCDHEGHERGLLTRRGQALIHIPAQLQEADNIPAAISVKDSFVRKVRRSCTPL